MSNQTDPYSDLDQPAVSGRPVTGDVTDGTAGFDVIGDVHGEYGKLLSLLARLGYRERSGVWAHPTRTAIFVGDLIDRGPEQVRTVTTVRAMVEADAAQIVMGNHEFNALGWMTANPAVPGDTLRQRLGGKGEVHRRQHQAFLDEVGEGSSLHQSMLEWFATIPLFLDLGTFRVVHACWDQDSIALLAAALPPGRALDDALLVALHDKSEPLGRALETVVKGPEYRLDEGLAYLDKDGNARRKARYAWWSAPGATMRDALVLPGGSRRVDGSPHPGFPDRELATPPVAPYTTPTPVFFGHYWFTGALEPKTPHIAGVDFSAAKGGPLVAYRFSGEHTLDATRFVASE